MKKNGKQIGLLGTIVVIIVYLVLVRNGFIHVNSDGEENVPGNAFVESTQTSEIADAPVSSEALENVSLATKEPEITTEPKEERTPEPDVSQEQVSTPQPTQEAEETDASLEEEELELTNYWFRTKKLRDSHFEKHGIEMGFETPEEYIEAANKVICNPKALHKLEAEDDDHIYFIEETNEFVVLSQDGYLRTYYIANGGIDYFNRQ